MKITTQFEQTLEEIAKTAPDEFSGIGLILYHDLLAISPYHCDLINVTTQIPKLRLGENDLLGYLNTISHYQHPYHDGFHLINHNGALSHIAQYIAPPLQQRQNLVSGQGSRTFCSQLVSALDGIVMVGTVTSKRAVYVFKQGVLIS